MPAWQIALATLRKTQEIDLALSVICCCLSPGQTLTLQEIADICNCRPGTIWLIERNALAKLRQTVPAWMHPADYLLD